MKTKKQGKEGYAAVKLDMSKAYDRVEWEFLERVMRKLGFADRWVQLVMTCITSVNYQVKVNGALTDIITPQRGLRQGDPLSPYLFLLCAEGFSSMLNKAELRGELEGIQICNGAPSFNHLLFADDSLVLIKANRESAKSLQNLLQLYEVCSGQTINFDKSSVMFSENTSEDRRRQVLTELHISEEAKTVKYLGLPVYVGRSRSKTFEYLLERIWKKIQGWKERMLSKVGKDILIKACAQAIPTFAMSCFDLTKTLCEKISTMICRWWWSQNDKENKMHWLSWDQLSKPKSEGGLGFRDLYGFNLAMLARQGWRMLMNPESLCAKVLKARYFPNSSILRATATPGISYSWRSILKGINLLKEGLIWRIGDGAKVNIWTDPWIKREGSRVPITPRRQCLLTRVEELVDPLTGQWDEQIVRDTFWDMDARIILGTPLRADFEDYPAWHFDNKGIFSVKSAYKLYVKQRDADVDTNSGNTFGSKFWKELWDLPCLPKVKQFMWRLAHNSLPLRMNIKRRGIECDTLCVCCKRLDEDGAHLFLKCKEAKEVWSMLKMGDVRDRMCTLESAGDVLQEIMLLNQEQKTLSCCLLWRSWLRRNKINAEGKRLALSDLAGQAKYWARESMQCINQKREDTKISTQPKWQKPPADKIKINFDGSFFADRSTGGWGFIARDAQGDVRGAGAGPIHHVSSAVQAEAIACGEAIMAATMWGMGSIILETDSINLAKALMSTEFDLAPEGIIFRDLRSYLSLNFVSSEVVFAPRACNKVAHELAALGVSQQNSRTLWVDTVPDDVMVVLASEFAVPG
jgi:hypothetical protein